MIYIYFTFSKLQKCSGIRELEVSFRINKYQNVLNVYQLSSILYLILTLYCGKYYDFSYFINKETEIENLPNYISNSSRAEL